MSDGVDRTSLLQPARNFCSSGRLFFAGLSLSSDSERCRISTDRLELRSATATTVAVGFGGVEDTTVLIGLVVNTTSSSCRTSSATDMISTDKFNRKQMLVSSVFTKMSNYY